MWLKVFTFVAALAVGFPAMAAAMPSSQCPRDDQAFAAKAEILIRVALDAERAKFAPDRPKLSPDPDLIDIAEQRSCAIAHGADFSHTDAEGHFIAADMVKARFGPHGFFGENIMKMGTMETIGVRFFGAGEFARAAVKGWMESPGHRDNILNPGFDLAGIGVAKVDGEAVATEVFFAPPHRDRPAQGRKVP